MSGRPRFSVVIPTRERAGTLRYALATCLDQDFEDYEVVVCDNQSSRATQEVVEAAASARVRYVRAERPLAMSANWELAIASAQGEYIMVIGDDDGLMPYALRELDRLLDEHPVKAVQWDRGIYTWPTMAIPGDANLLLFPLYRGIAAIDGRDFIARVARFEAGAEMLPMLYNAAIHRDLIEEHRAIAGRVFPNLYPDLYTGFAFAYLAGTYLSVGVPMSVAGLSGASNGVAILMNPSATTISEEFAALNAVFGYASHPLVPQLALPFVAIVDSFLHAKDLLFPTDDTLVMDRKAVARLCLAMDPATDPDARRRVRETIRASLSDEPDVQRWFDQEVPDFPPGRPFRFRPDRLGFDGRHLALDARAVGVADVGGAVRFVTAVLGVDSEPIRYDLPPPG